ncbi:MAG: uL15 family ribosomal protein [Clostridia bacterium]|nr:uL15 family ribosomal protein [Clostridia bacterium]
MKIAIIVFIIVSSLFSISSITYVTVDWIYEKTKKKEDSEPRYVPTAPTPEPKPEPIPEPIPEPEPLVIPEPVEHISAEEADEMLSDEVAIAAVVEDLGPKTEGERCFINLGVVDGHFEPGETVNLAALQAKGLVPRSAKRLKILADGILTKSLTVEAQSFSVQAIKMIQLTGGTVVRKR